MKSGEWTVCKKCTHLPGWNRLHSIGFIVQYTHTEKENKTLSVPHCVVEVRTAWGPQLEVARLWEQLGAFHWVRTAKYRTRLHCEVLLLGPGSGDRGKFSISR